MSRCRCSHADAPPAGLAEELDQAADPSRPGLRRITPVWHIWCRGIVEEQVTAAINEARQRIAGFQRVQVLRLKAEPLAQRICETCSIRETAVPRG